MKRIERFIETYPNQLAAEFRQILRAFRNKEVTRHKVKQLMMEKIATAVNTIRPVRVKKS